MDTSYSSTDPSSSATSYCLSVPKGSKETNHSKCVVVALGVIILIGSLVASGLLYVQIGNWSFAIGGGGCIVGLGLVVLECKTSSQSHINERSESQIPLRASDIKLPKIMPEDFEKSNEKLLFDFSSHLIRYMTYLALQFPEIFVYEHGYQVRQTILARHQGTAPPAPKGEELIDASINELEKHIFEYVPAHASNSNDLDIPFFLRISQNHWALVYIDRKRRSVEYFNSIKNYGNHSDIVKILTSIADKLSEKQPGKSRYTFENKIHKTLQKDGYQCGPWVLFFLEHRLINPDFDFNQLNVNEAQDLIKKYRIKVLLKLNELNEACCTCQSKALQEYQEYYQNDATALQMFRIDMYKDSPVEDFRKLFKGQFLVPQPISSNSRV